MIRDDIPSQWADTQLPTPDVCITAACVSDRCRQGRTPCPTPTACRYVADKLPADIAELQRYSSGQPIAGEDVADTSSTLPWLTLPRFWRFYVAFCGLMALLLAVHLIASYWPYIAARLT